MPHERLSACRLCGWEDLPTVLDLGEMAFTGIFPKPGEDVPSGPLELVKCGACNLVQLAHVYDQAVLYGPSYGYRSGLNQTMVAHLKEVAALAWREARAEPGETVIDIGANDGTLLAANPKSARRVGIDPLADKWADCWPEGAVRIAKSFPCSPWSPKGDSLNLPAAVVTSIACLYDAQEPVKWARVIANWLRPGGIWIIELALAGHILSGAWDQVCHEHALYFGASQLSDLMTRAGLRVVKAVDTSTNGGSLLLVAKKEEGCHLWSPREREEDWPELTHKIEKTCVDLRECLEAYKAAGKTVWGYGASTKGNVVLQRAGIESDLLPRIMDANQEKDGKQTPGTQIPIFTHTGSWVAPPGLKDERAGIGGPLQRPHAFLVLPWHFRDFVIEKEYAFLEASGKLIFALPKLEIVTKESLNRSKEDAA